MGQVEDCILRSCRKFQRKEDLKMMQTVAKNNFIEACEKILNDKPNKKGIRLQKTQYVGNYKGEVMTITIKRGDKLNELR
jgi:phosphoglycerate-specific signal transduction histidine kinase